MKSRFPFDHPQIEAVLERQHSVAAADKWKLIPRLPSYLWAKLSGRLAEQDFRHRVFFDVYSAVTRERGALLYLIARAIGAKRVVEFGSSFGISTIYLATAVRDNFPGESAPAAQVVGSEMEPHKVTEAAKNIEAAGLSDLVKIRQGDALETLAEIDGPIDLAFLDGRKDLYLPVLKLLEPMLRPGAVVLSDNIHSFRKEVAPFLEYVQRPKNGFASSTLGLSDGMEFSVYQRAEK
ncbi:MAG TPA: class I SAM-dependent methyltransferase [Candidatus Acidoferrum sp.]|jgi:predicted O-methyltransferase YrrM|nr:class I SAM-dependent methyltransferase [Candidatus Acidoferrum sp.]